MNMSYKKYYKILRFLIVSWAMLGVSCPLVGMQAVEVKAVVKVTEKATDAHAQVRQDAQQGSDKKKPEDNETENKTLVSVSDVWSKDQDGNTSLHRAAKNGEAFTCITLLGKIADVNAKNNNQDTPLHLAARGGHADVCRALIDYKATVDAKNKNLETPLFDAVRHKHEAVCKTLIDAQASVTIKNKQDFTVFDINLDDVLPHEIRVILEKNTPDSLSLLGRALSWFN